MSTFELREVRSEEIAATSFPIQHYAFDKTPAEDKRDEWLEAMPYYIDRYFVVGFEDDQPVATANNINMTQNVRGQVYKAGGVAGVAVHPTRRRKGYARQVVANCLAKSRELDHVFSTLYPFRESFYERLGYVTFPHVRKVTFSPLALEPILQLDIPDGEVEIQKITEAYDTYRTFMQDIQTQTHGLSLRTHKADRRLRDKGKNWLALARQNDELVGLMAYKVEGYAKSLTAYRFHYRAGVGKYLLLNWVARHADQVAKATLYMKPNDFIETWQSDLEAEVQTPLIRNDESPTPMGRIVIVDEMGGMQTGPGRFTATIEDEYCPWNNATWTFETKDGVLTTRISGPHEADCTLTINGLSALAYGVGDPGDFAVRGWGDPSSEIQQVIRSMFPQAFPYLHEYF